MYPFLTLFKLYIFYDYVIIYEKSAIKWRCIYKQGHALKDPMTARMETCLPAIRSRYLPWSGWFHYIYHQNKCNKLTENRKHFSRPTFLLRCVPLIDCYNVLTWIRMVIGRGDMHVLTSDYMCGVCACIRRSSCAHVAYIARILTIEVFYLYALTIPNLPRLANPHCQSISLYICSGNITTEVLEWLHVSFYCGQYQLDNKANPRPWYVQVTSYSRT